MRQVPNKSAAIRAILKAAKRPLFFHELHQALEAKLEQVIGRHKLKTLLSVMQTNDGDVRGKGRGETRTYEAIA